MYSKCLFCHSDLGTNEVIERFPIGRRLAFDEAKGRLWVVCTACARWNLTPIEERWEAIEDCERRFRATHLRLSTEHIGLAKLSEGLELVRVGKPQRPEMAAWRYGASFRARRTRALVIEGLSYAALTALVIVSPVQIFQLGSSVLRRTSSPSRRPGMIFGPSVVGRFRDEAGAERLLRRQQAARTVLLPKSATDEWGLRVRHDPLRENFQLSWQKNPFVQATEVRGQEARLLMKGILPVINFGGARDAEVREALGYLDKYHDPNALLNRAAGIASKIGWESDDDHGEIANLPAGYRLALEMAVNEDTERRALEGELELLEDAWREAEEIAAISDNLLLPKGVISVFARLKARVSKQ
jgi:hypothetical protein